MLVVSDVKQMLVIRRENAEAEMYDVETALAFPRLVCLETSHVHLPQHPICCYSPNAFLDSADVPEPYAHRYTAVSLER